MSPSPTAQLFAVLSFAAGVWAFVQTQTATKELFEPIVAACTSKDYATMEDFVKQTGYHEYDKRVGLVVLDFLVCLITQFLLDLTKWHPAGMIVWGTTLVVAFPVGVLMSLEAGRSKNRGPILWPTTMGMLLQLFGISVIFPAIWVPSYVWGGSKEGIVNMNLASFVFLMTLPGAILSALVFILDTDTPLWTTCAGILGGPGLPLISLVIMYLPAPKKNVTKELAMTTAAASVISFGIAGWLACVGWIYLLYVMFSTYGTDYRMLLDDLWYMAHPSVKFMTIDACVLWVGLMLHIGSRSVKTMGEALVFTPIFGPGAAGAMALASLELERYDTMPDDESTSTTKKDE